MTVKALSRKIAAVETSEGAGAIVKRVFPTKNLMHFDPFVLLDEFSIRPPAGFPDHPHGGFEAITYMLEGGFHHRDNIGNDRVIMAGGIQKFTAGKGIVHSELPGTDGLNRGLQLWTRLPKKLQNMEPDYQQVEPTAVPEKSLNSNRIRIIAGEGSPVKLYTKITYLDVRLHSQSKFSYDTDPKGNTMLYLLEGTINVGPSSVNTGEAAFLTDGETVEVMATGKTRFVLLSGKPHNERIMLRGSYIY